MRNKNDWIPTKYVYHGSHLRASRDPCKVSVGSRMICDIIADWYQRNLEKHARGRLLDLGCGNVPFYSAYKDFVSENVCVDWMNTCHKNSYLDMECDLSKPLPFCDGEFDTIILSDVLEHIPDPSLLWHEIGRVLTCNGKIILNVPFFYWLHEQPHDYYRYTEFALRRFAEQSGFRVVQLQPMGGAPEVMADLVGKNLIRLPWIGQQSAAILQWSVSLLMKLQFFKRWSESTNRVFPLGYFMIAQKIQV